MNMVDVHIKEVHSVKEYPEAEGFVVVDMTTDCWGAIDRVEEVFHIERWEQIRKEGKYLS